MHTHCGKPREICPAHSLPNGVGYTARKRKRLSITWLWLIKLLYSGECVDDSQQTVNLPKNQEVFLPNLLVCQNSHTKKAKGTKKP